MIPTLRLISDLCRWRLATYGALIASGRPDRQSPRIEHAPGIAETGDLMRVFPVRFDLFLDLCFPLLLVAVADSTVEVHDDLLDPFIGF